MSTSNASAARVARDLVAYAVTALVGVAGYGIWQAAVSFAHVVRSTEWTIAIVCFVAALAWAGTQLVRSHRAAISPSQALLALEQSREVLRRVVPLSTTAGWRFADEPSQFVLDPVVEKLVPHIRPALERALLDILENPLGNSREVVRGELVYIKRIRPSVTSVLVPALLLAYTATQRERLIRLRSLAAGREADAVFDALPGGDETMNALQRVFAREMRDAAQPGAATVN